jgi:hypothetical protein
LLTAAIHSEGEPLSKRSFVFVSAYRNGETPGGHTITS